MNGSNGRLWRPPAGPVNFALMTGHKRVCFNTWDIGSAIRTENQLESGTKFSLVRFKALSLQLFRQIT